MKVITMRRIDAWIGVPACFCAGLLAAASRILRKSSAAAGIPKSILVIKLSELGALVTLGPAMRSLRELVGRDHLYFLTFEASRELLEVLDYVPRQNVLILRTDSLAHLFWDALLRLLRIRGLRLDCSVDLDFFSRATALIGWFSGCRSRVGCHAYFGEGPFRGDLLTHRVKFNPHIHVSQMFQVLAKAAEKGRGDFPCMDFVADPVRQPQERFVPTAAEEIRVDRLLSEVGVGPQDVLILLNANISDRESVPLRKWPDERYRELARLILEGIPEAFVLLTGTPQETECVARLEAGVGLARCRSVAGKTTLRALLSLYGKSAVMVTNDSGPAHFATLTGIGVVVLFGPETPSLWRPLGDRVQVISRGLACSPCFTVYNGRQSSCRRNICMDIDPLAVYKMLRELTDGSGRWSVASGR